MWTAIGCGGRVPQDDETAEHPAAFKVKVGNWKPTGLDFGEAENALT